MRELQELSGVFSAKLESGAQGGRYETYAALATALRVSVRWLWLGEGEMEPEAPSPGQPIELEESVIRELLGAREAEPTVEAVRRVVAQRDDARAALRAIVAIAETVPKGQER
jgi:hypothetical protein